MPLAAAEHGFDLDTHTQKHTVNLMQNYAQVPYVLPQSCDASSYSFSSYFWSPDLAGIKAGKQWEQSFIRWRCGTVK